MIYVKKLNELSKYGFIYKDYRYQRNGKGKSWMSVRNKDNALMTNGYSLSIIETICKMYKDGVVEIIEENTLESRICRKKQQIAKLQKQIKELENEKN